jgi:DNA-binding transcriptional LysR family regulator
VPDSFALLCLGGFMKTLEAQQPDLRIAVTVDNSRALTLRLEDGLLDLAVLAQPQTVKDFRVEPLGVQRLVWVAASTMRLPRRTLGPKELVDRQIVTNPAPSTSFSVLMDWFGAAGLTPRHVSTCNSVAVIACVVASGAWISPLPACIIEEQVQNGALKLVPTQPPLPGQHMFAAYPKAPASQALPEVIDVIRRTISRTRFVEADI